MGISESRLDEIARTIWHGESARFDEFGHIEFKYRSNSGKMKMIARLTEENGSIAIDQGLCNSSNRSNTPGIFAGKIFEEANKKFDTESPTEDA